jgi:hypothetical protein
MSGPATISYRYFRRRHNKMLALGGCGFGEEGPLVSMGLSRALITQRSPVGLTLLDMSLHAAFDFRLFSLTPRAAVRRAAKFGQAQLVFFSHQRSGTTLHSTI